MQVAAQLIGSFGLFLLLLACGMAVPFAIAIPGVAYLFFQNGLSSLYAIGLVTWGSMNSFTLTAIRLFILMAEMTQRSGLSFRIYRGLAELVSALPGGLLQTNIVGCALFGAISGSSVATAASIGGVALPQLLQRDYDRRLSVGSLAAGGTLGILFPPGIAMIIHSSFTNTSVAKLFMAGVISGLMLTGMFMGYIGARSIWRRRSGRHVESQGGLLAAMADIVPFALLISGTMGSIYAGIATPTEAASAGCFFAVLLCIVWGDLTWKLFLESMHRTLQIVGNLMFNIYVAYIYAYAIGVAGVGETVTSWLIGLRPHVRRTGRPVSQYAGYEGWFGWSGPEPPCIGRRVVRKTITYVGLDVHKDTIAVSLADPGLRGSRGEVREYGKIANTAGAVEKLVKKLAVNGNFSTRFGYFVPGPRLSHLEFFLALLVLYSALGCLVESIGMIVITVPLLFPVLCQYGIDPIWFGVLLVMFVELGQISPSIGIYLFVSQSIWNGELGDVVFGTIPFHIIMFVLLFLLMVSPQIALWLRGHMS